MEYIYIVFDMSFFYVFGIVCCLCGFRVRVSICWLLMIMIFGFDMLLCCDIPCLAWLLLLLVLLTWLLLVLVFDMFGILCPIYCFVSWHVVDVLCWLSCSWYVVVGCVGSLFFNV